RYPIRPASWPPTKQTATFAPCGRAACCAKTPQNQPPHHKPGTAGHQSSNSCPATPALPNSPSKLASHKSDSRLRPLWEGSLLREVNLKPTTTPQTRHSRPLDHLSPPGPSWRARSV